MTKHAVDYRYVMVVHFDGIEKVNAYGGSRFNAPLILDLGARWVLVYLRERTPMTVE